eukprot:8779836-Alexandrium_andersonii.AAC.1
MEEGHNTWLPHPSAPATYRAAPLCAAKTHSCRVLARLRRRRAPARCLLCASRECESVASW